MTSALMQALRFSEADLDANRAGQLSPAQLERMHEARRRQMVIAALIFLSLVLLATGFIYGGQRSQNQILAVAGWLLIVINAILVGSAGRAFMRYASDMRAGNVEALAGDVERVLRRGRQGDAYLIRIRGQSLRVTREVFLSFQHEAPYRVYRTVREGLLLSAEALD